MRRREVFRLNRDRRDPRFVRYWLPVLLYVGLIFAVSSLPRLEPPIRLHDGDKLAHVLEYGVLGYLLVRALRSTARWAAPLAGGLLALTIGLGIGAADELYQATIPGRDSTVHDWVADATGLLLAQMAYLLVKRD